jgi:predicted component of type VI protein secretion system
MTAMRIARVLVALSATALLAGCGPKKDPDFAAASDPQPLVVGTPLMADLECDAGEGDCDEWFRVEVAEGGTLEVIVTNAAGQGVGTPLALTLADAKELPLAQSQNQGRPRFGARWAVQPGAYFAWLHADGSTRGKLSFQIAATMSSADVGDLGTDVDPTSPRLCVRVQSGPRANFYEGRPHVVRLVIFPLTSALGFEQASESMLLGGGQPQGAAGEPIQARIVPGETRSLTDTLPAGTRTLGVVADYYRSPGAGGAPRKLTLPASCANGGTNLYLDEREIRQQ